MDAVITWVDGNDPSFREKLNRYATNNDQKRDDVGSTTRFADNGEIFWCVVAINRFAPFIDRIFIVTYGQNPHLEEKLEEVFPEGFIPIVIVDHSVIFKGYEQYLPTFNSNSIETMIWRIPEMSDRFIFFNDDVILSAPVTEEDFFSKEGKTICYGQKYSRLLIRIQNALKSKRYGQKRISWKGSMMTAADMIDNGSFILKLSHSPKALRKSFYEDFFAKHPEAVILNIKDKFRQHYQYNVQELQNLSDYKAGRCVLLPDNEHLFFFKKDYTHLDDELKRLDGGNFKFVCFNSLDKASPEQFEKIESWFNRRLDL